MTVEAMKRYVKVMASLGFNALLLYMEDTYEIPEYPRFGYARGRYTQAELREIDAFADGLGIEIIPCIQTLGHMAQYLRWNEAADVRDTEGVLLCGEEKTYHLIDAMLCAMRGAFKSCRIHIGMDETFDLGLGVYLQRNGYQNRFDVMTVHLKRVLGLCEKYGFTPMMWSDMFFRLYSDTGAGFEPNAQLPAEKRALIPDVELVYWDYYRTDGAAYEAIMNAHKKMGKKTLFAGGIWTWGRALPDVSFTFDSMKPALEK
jgi:hypothetical protein